MWMVSYVVGIALSVTHLGKVIRGNFDLVLGILNFAFNYGPYRIEQKQLRDKPISNLLIIAHDVNQCSMTSVSVIYFFDFICYLFLKSYAPFNNF